MNHLKPKLRGHLHQAMFFVSVGACALLIAKSNTPKQLIATIIYSICVLFMFGVSALYHRIHWRMKARALVRKIDHSAIYFMIAGTCTPLALIALDEVSGMRLLISIWCVAFFGTIQSIFFVNLPKLVSALLYLVAGYIVTPYSIELWPKMGVSNMALLFSGGFIYSIGAIVYGLKRPTFNSTIFGYHEVFHACVSIGAIFHFMMIYSTVS